MTDYIIVLGFLLNYILPHVNSVIIIIFVNIINLVLQELIYRSHTPP